MKTSLHACNKLHPPNFNLIVSSPTSALKEHFTVKRNVCASLCNNVINQHSGKHVTILDTNFESYLHFSFCSPIFERKTVTKVEILISFLWCMTFCCVSVSPPPPGIKLTIKIILCIILSIVTINDNPKVHPEQYKDNIRSGVYLFKLSCKLLCFTINPFIHTNKTSSL